MNNTVQRILVSKKKGFDCEEAKLKSDMKSFLGIECPCNLRIVNIYYFEDVESDTRQILEHNVFSDPVQDDILEDFSQFKTVIATELLPGQFDARANAAKTCIELITCKKSPEVRVRKAYCFSDELDEKTVDLLKKYLINPVEMRLSTLQTPSTLEIETNDPAPVETIDNFSGLSVCELESLIDDLSLSIDIDDMKLAQSYFSREARDPTITEIKVIDTYWSDHCRHTTFNTTLENIDIDDPRVKEAYSRYLDLKEEIDRSEKPTTLMDISTIAARVLKKRGLLKEVDESEENNACTLNAKVDVDGVEEDWLYFFKNETHNHPTEIEPYGGAATCLGGAIRDPLSGRSYVYQSMRITGAANPLQKFEEVREGKLPQRQITTISADGFSSYGNQIGLATGLVEEIYHPGYEAKRMEVGAVVGAAPKENVIRKTPKEGDRVILIGGRTGRDGIGGASGSSRSHNKSSVDNCACQVQKGNPIEERKLQRFFRRSDAAKLIVRCNDFGAGGISVAVGELADGLKINLDAVKTKYEGLDGTELALSESQERMACVVEKNDVSRFLEIAVEENLEAYEIAEVTEEKRMVEVFKGQTIVDISREFLDSAGAEKRRDVSVKDVAEGVEVSHAQTTDENLSDYLKRTLSNLNCASKKGLGSMFDSTIGSGSVLFPHSGKNQLTPAIAMVAKLPVDGHTNTVSGMSWGYNPYVSSIDPYRGAYLAVVDSVTKLVASGFSLDKVYLSLQEYFKKLECDPENWGAVFSSVLGAMSAMMDLDVAAIGGKDSMSGTFEDISVPNTLISFATAIGRAENVVSPDFKEVGNKVLLISPAYSDGLPDAESLKTLLNVLKSLIDDKNIATSNASGNDSVIATLFKSAVGNSLGIMFDEHIDKDVLNSVKSGSVIVEVTPENKEFVIGKLAYCKSIEVLSVGTLAEKQCFAIRENDETSEVDLDDLTELWRGKLEEVYPSEVESKLTEAISSNEESPKFKGPAILGKKPKVIIPVFPGTNCEFDTMRAFADAGADPESFVIKTLSPEHISASVDELQKRIDECQILMLAGGFSGGDEPDGSGKLIASFLRNPKLADSIMNLLQKRDGLVLGICNGFQALVKLGLLPYGEIRESSENDPTLARNSIPKHISSYVNTRVCSKLSPWFSRVELGDVHTIPISHGEGRFCCSELLLNDLIANGQICTQYCTFDGKTDTDTFANPNGSVCNIEAICSPDGRVLGKMGHSERRGEYICKNIQGNKFQPIFEAGVDYFAG